MKNRICTNCGIAFDWPPVSKRGETYCCDGCAEGGPCNCDYALLRSNASRVVQPIRVVRFEIRTAAE